VQEDTLKPFLLVSFPGPQPNLHAINPEDNITISNLICMYNQQQILRFKEQSLKVKVLFQPHSVDVNELIADLLW